jgi:hypothetical protein
LTDKPLNPTVTSDAYGRYALTIQLKIQNDQLHRRYYADQRFITDDSAPWSALEDVLKQWRTKPEMCEGFFRHTLFEALTGSKLLEALSHVCSTPVVTPIAQPIRLRIHTDNALLAEQPWALIQWQERNLLDENWLFELIADAPDRQTRRFQPKLQERFHVLTMLPPGNAGWSSHQHDLSQQLRDIWQVTADYIHPAGSAAAIETIYATAEMAPALIYFCGPARLENDILMLQLADGTLYPIEQLVAHWGEHRWPTIIFLNLTTDTGLYLGTALAGISQKAPLVITQVARNDQHEKLQQTFLAWLHEVLTGGDPVHSLHQKGYTGATVWTHYDRWQLKGPKKDEIPLDRLAHLLLDRTEERRLVSSAAIEQVIAIVA